MWKGGRRFERKENNSREEGGDLREKKERKKEQTCSEYNQKDGQQEDQLEHPTIVLTKPEPLFFFVKKKG